MEKKGRHWNSDGERPRGVPPNHKAYEIMGEGSGSIARASRFPTEDIFTRYKKSMKTWLHQKKWCKDIKIFKHVCFSMVTKEGLFLVGKGRFRSKPIQTTSYGTFFLASFGKKSWVFVIKMLWSQHPKRRYLCVGNRLARAIGEEERGGEKRTSRWNSRLLIKDHLLMQFHQSINSFFLTGTKLNSCQQKKISAWTRVQERTSTTRWEK